LAQYAPQQLAGTEWAPRTAAGIARANTSPTPFLRAGKIAKDSQKMPYSPNVFCQDDK
jgi:hypothetical protein